MSEPDLTPVPVDISAGEVCSKQFCFNPATWKVLNKLLCYDHMALAEWLPGIPKKPRRSPHGKKNQLKFQFMEARDDDRTERQGKEDAQAVSGGRADQSVRTGETDVPVDGGEVNDEGQQLDQKLPAEADSPQDGEASRPGSVPASPAGEREEGGPPFWEEGFVVTESVDPFADTEPVEEVEWPEPEGEAPDPDFKRDARRNGDFDHVWRD